MASNKQRPQGLQSPEASTTRNAHSKYYQQDQTPVERVLSALESVGSGIQSSTKGYSANCPAHEDRKPSLRVSEGGDGRALLYCHGGCTVDEVLTALGLEIRDLYPESEIVANYPYTDETGDLIFEVVRLRPKGFFARRPNGDGGWINDLHGVDKVLYRLPQVTNAIGEREVSGRGRREGCRISGGTGRGSDLQSRRGWDGQMAR